MNPPPPVLLQRASDRHRCLPIDDAWAIALAWQEPLQGHVLLEVEGETVHKSYAWVRFEPHWIRYDNTPTVSAARAAAVAWFALSCCPGYSGRENPVFWKCVFSEMAPQRVHIDTVPNFRGGPRTWHTDIQSVTDAHGFFDRDGVEFPRFRLPFHHYNAGVRLFCGLPGEQLEPEDEVRLQRIIDQLTPWIDHQRAIRCPVFALDKLDLSHYAGYDNVCGPSKAVPQVALLQLLSDIHHTRSTMPTWPAPTFTIDSLTIEGEINAQNASQVQRLLGQLIQHDVEIKIKLSIREPLNRNLLASIVRCVLPPPGTSHRAKITSLDLSAVDQSSLSAFLSALPHATSVRAVKVYPPQPFYRRFLPRRQFVQLNYISAPRRGPEKRDLAWLGYALFHPDTQSSAWKSLNLVATALTDNRVAMLQSMARGNNLASLLHGETDRSTLGYYRATLAPNTAVYDQPIKTRRFAGLWQRLMDLQLLMTTDAITTVEVCGVSTEDHTKWDESVQVVVPGYGLGWVLSANVTRVEKRRPSNAMLTALYLDHMTLDSMTSRGINTVFQLVGHRLVHLEMSCQSNLVSTNELEQVLANCPAIESLAVPYEVALWKDATVSSLLPHLRELEMRIDMSRILSLPLIQFPRSLQALRIDAQCLHQDPTHSYVDAVQQVLLRPSDLRVFHWQDGLHCSHHPAPYVETCADTERRLDEVGIPMQQRRIAASRLPASCAAAFLSIAHTHRLDSEVARIVVAFAGHCAPRWIVLEPRASEIPEDRQRNRQRLI